MWSCTAYGLTFMANTFETLVDCVDDYGQLHNLRAVSVVAHYED